MKITRPLNVFMIAMMNIAAICSIANLSISAENGLSALFYLAIALVSFFLPVALISAELASGWPNRGVYTWVREALGEKFGFLAIWLQWAENIIWYPGPLSFLASIVAYIVDPALAENKIYIMVSILVIFWLITLINLFGMRISGWISSICGVTGTLLPGILIITFGVSWLFLGFHSNVEFSWKNLFPSSHLGNQIGFLAGILMSLGGLEMSANHGREVTNPQRSYPIAIFVSAAAIFIIYALGSLSVAVIVPNDQINLASASIAAIHKFFQATNVPALIPILSFLVGVGSFGMISTWVVGPSKGILASAENGDLPPILQKTNKKNMPVSLLIVQATIVSVISLVYLFMPSVSSSYLIILTLSALIYLIMYIIMFISAIVLRYKQPNVKRTFKIPFGKVGIWITALLGIFSALFAIAAGFFPPEVFKKQFNTLHYDLFLIIGIIIIVTIPIIITCKKHAGWLTHYEKNRKN